MSAHCSQMKIARLYETQSGSVIRIHVMFQKTMHLAEWLTALPFTFFIPQLRILPTYPVTHFTILNLPIRSNV